MGIKEYEALISDLQGRVKDIEYRLGHIVELPTELDIRLQDVERIIDKIPDNYTRKDKELSKRIDALEKNKYVQQVQYFGIKPHKCPVCDGCGNDKGTQQQNPNYDFFMQYASCKACEGKGVIWG